jgi:hypothetical protein
MTSFSNIEDSIEAEYQRVKGIPPQFDRQQLPATPFRLEDHSPSMMERIRKHDLHSILDRVFQLRFVGPILQSLWILMRLSHHIKKIRNDIFDLRVELRRAESLLGSRHRDYVTQTRERLERIEKKIMELPK